MTVAPSFSLLAEVHHWLNQIFLDHPLALLSLDLPAASACLERYESNLKLHIDDEESALIPLYDARTDNVPGGAVELFTGEHTKLTGFIAEFHQTLLAITGKSDRDLRLDIIKTVRPRSDLQGPGRTPPCSRAQYLVSLARQDCF
jgi:hypothetical protein